MEKKRFVREYSGTVKENMDFLQNYYYHSLIDLNLIKLESILLNGILSKEEIERKNIPSLYTHSAQDFDSKNGKNFVSLSQLRNDISFNSLFESFSLHTLSCISLMVNKSVNASVYGERESFFDDELFVRRMIPSSSIEGILIPSHLLNEKVSNLPLIPNDLSCYSKSYIINLLTLMENYFQTTIDKEQVKESLKRLWSLFRDVERPENFVSFVLEEQRKIYGMDIKDELALIMSDLYSKKYGINNPTVIDIIDRINPQKDIYELTYKNVRKIR